jgi:hypothetical protein
MAKYAKKSLTLFFSAKDEKQFEADAKKLVSTICFVDGSVWQTTTPNVKHSLAACQSRIVYLWDPKACPNLPFQSLGDGGARGPTSGVVIQYIRPHCDGNVLTSGDMGIGYEKDNVAIAQFVKDVWKVAQAMNSATLCSFAGDTDEILERNIDIYVVGPDAVRFSKEKSGLLKHHGANDLYYRAE